MRFECFSEEYFTYLKSIERIDNLIKDAKEIAMNMKKVLNTNETTLRKYAK